MVRRGGRNVASFESRGSPSSPQERAEGKNLGMRAPRLATTDESVPALFLWSGARQARRSMSSAHPPVPSSMLLARTYM